MVGVEERREFRFRGDLYSQESTFPLVHNVHDNIRKPALILNLKIHKYIQIYMHWQQKCSMRNQLLNKQHWLMVQS